MATLRGEITISAAPAPCATSFVPAGKLVTATLAFSGVRSATRS